MLLGAGKAWPGVLYPVSSIFSQEKCVAYSLKQQKWKEIQGNMSWKKAVEERRLASGVCKVPFGFLGRVVVWGAMFIILVPVWGALCWCWVLFVSQREKPILTGEEREQWETLHARVASVPAALRNSWGHHIQIFAISGKHITESHS